MAIPFPHARQLAEHIAEEDRRVADLMHNDPVFFESVIQSPLRFYDNFEVPEGLDFPQSGEPWNYLWPWASHGAFVVSIQGEREDQEGNATEALLRFVATEVGKAYAAQPDHDRTAFNDGLFDFAQISDPNVTVLVFDGRPLAGPFGDQFFFYKEDDGTIAALAGDFGADLNPAYSELDMLYPTDIVSWDTDPDVDEPVDANNYAEDFSNAPGSVVGVWVSPMLGVPYADDDMDVVVEDE